MFIFNDKIELDLHSTISLAVSLCLNLAACANKLRGFEEALIYCSMVLYFFPRNPKALFRKAVALKKLNRFSEAFTTLEEASVAEPHNKVIIHELEDVRQSLAFNANGKRVLVDSENATDGRAGKVLISLPQSQDDGSPLHRKEAALVELMDVASHDSTQLCSDSEDEYKKQVESPVSGSISVPNTSPEVPMVSMTVSEDSQSSSSPNSRLPALRFTNKKRPHNVLNLSSQDYDQLLHGKDLGFYHPRSMSFMRVRTLSSKTIQTGTPHEVSSGPAEVPTSSPTTESFSQAIHVDQTTCVGLVQEEVVCQVYKKARLTSASSCISRVSLDQFRFAAVKEDRSRLYSTGKRKVRCSHDAGRRSCSVACSKTRSTIPAVSLSFCRYNQVITRTKRKKVQTIDFDAQYHRPFKKYRLFTSSTVSSVFQVSSYSGGFHLPSFVIS